MHPFTRRQPSDADRSVAPTVSPCAAPSKPAQIVGPHKEMAITVVGHPAELAHFSDERHNVDLAPTGLAQAPNAPRSRSGMAQRPK
jgi:hypothetical protein